MKMAIILIKKEIFINFCLKNCQKVLLNIEPKVTKEEILNRMNYAREYLKTIGYNSSSFKNLNILAFSKALTDVKLDEGLKSFCVSTIE